MSGITSDQASRTCWSALLRLSSERFTSELLAKATLIASGSVNTLLLPMTSLPDIEPACCPWAILTITNNPMATNQALLPKNDPEAYSLLIKPPAFCGSQFKRNLIIMFEKYLTISD